MLSLKLNNWLLKYKDAIVKQIFATSIEEQMKCTEEIMKLEREWSSLVKEADDCENDIFRVDSY